MKRSKYPHEYHDFSDGVEISDEEINKWIDEMLEHLEETPESDYASTASGKVHVHIRRIDEIDMEYEIIVSRGCESLYV